MSFSSTIASATRQAHQTLAQIQGMPTGGTNVLFATGAKCYGVYDFPQVQEEPMAGGGYRKRTVVRLSLPRDQTALRDIPWISMLRTKIVRTDLPTRFSYIIDHVDTQQAHAYLLTLVNFTP